MLQREGKALRLLSFDGGGSRCASQLKILDSIMCRIQYDEYPDDPDKVILPCDYFDLCGGSDAGGLIVILLIKLRLSIEEASIAFDNICKRVYEPVDITAEERSTRLKSYLEELLRKRGVPLDTKMFDSMTHGGCSGFVVARPRSNLQSLTTFRSYRIRAERTVSISVIDAALATCAAHPSFLPVAVGPDGRQTEYIGTTLGANNPVREVISEAHALFGGDVSVASLISLGAGDHGTISIKEGSPDQDISSVLRTMVVSCERVANEVAIQLGNLGFYFRLSVKHGLQAMNLSPSTIYSATSDYLNDPEVSSKLEQCVTSLEFRLGLTTLEQLSRSINLVHIGSLSPLVCRILWRWTCSS
ncbi:hypothetical protein FRB91_003936 [Serendipita sp. 411]|nr:hypothetical protein FRC18_007136 [Serendipita sp. 400]KAG8836001.1 hypothetical protein FRC20_007145 [Serendipita sp. 405]KAG8842762.1 hypothetical protein FRB91_003936 [Serendipita sp. 411]